MKQNLYIVSLMTVLLVCETQITRDMALKFMHLDKDGDLLLNSTQMQPIKFINESIPQGKYYYWLEYKNQIYPRTFWINYDTDNDGRISYLQFIPIVRTKMKRHAIKWPASSKNVLNSLTIEDYFQICDLDEDKYLVLDQLMVCVKAFTKYEYDQYPYKIKSILFPNRTIGYTLEQFGKLFPSNASKAQNRLQVLFDKFEWDEQKVKKDSDLMIGPEQGKFVEPSLIFFYSDLNKDQILDKEESLKYFKARGGDEAFRMADFTGDKKLDKAEIIAYYIFASCINEQCEEKHKKLQACSDEANIPENKKSMCKILKGLNKHLAKLSEQKKEEQKMEGEIQNIKQTYQQL